MADFHCPLGAEYRGDSGCVWCGMCVAQSQQDMVRAGRILREHMKDQAKARYMQRAIRKIAVCGKGGAGKSSFTALLSAALTGCGYQCIVIDADDSNSGLGRKLGFSQSPSPLLHFLPRFAPEGTNEQRLAWFREEQIPWDSIPEEFYVFHQGVLLMESGKISDPFQGCSCPMGAILQELLKKLEPASNQIVLVDVDAGVESFGRGVEQGCDTVLTLVEPSFEAIRLALTIQELAQGIGIRRVRAIVNKVTDDEQREYIEDALAEQDVRFLGCIPMDPQVTKTNLRGQPIAREAAFREVCRIVRLLLDEAEMPYRE